jgi:hypothetical protein
MRNAEVGSKKRKKVGSQEGKKVGGSVKRLTS